MTAPWIWAWSNPAHGRVAVVHSGGVRVSLHDGWRALLGETLPVLVSAGRAQPRRRRGGEDRVSHTRN